MRRIRVPGIGLSAAFLTVLLVSSTASAQAPMRDELKTVFDGAVRLYRVGEYEKAAQEFEKALKMSPSNEEAIILREQAGINLLVEMLRDARFAESARAILRKSQAGRNEVRRDPATIKAAIDKMASDDFAERNTAINQLVASAPFSIPHLLDHALGNEPPSLISKRSGALIAIQKSGAAGIPPLTVALRCAAPESAARIAGLIAMNPDARAVPDMLSVIEDKDRPDYLVKATREALEKMQVSRSVGGAPTPGTETPAAQTATEAFLQIAARYYYHDPLLIELVAARDRALWRWKADGATFADRLIPVEVPLYAYPRLMAQDYLVEGMKQKCADPNVLALYVANNYLQLADARAAADGRDGDLRKVLAINESLGTEALYLALARALTDGSAPLALDCIEALRNIGDGRRPLVANSLAQAMTFPDRLVRANAAETILRLSPGGALADPVSVVNVLTAGLGIPARETVAILTADPELAKQLAAGVQAADMVAETHTDIVNLMNRIKQRLPAANVLIVDARLRGPQTPILVKSIRDDPRSANTGIVLVAMPNDAAALREACNLEPVAVLPMPVGDAALKTALLFTAKQTAPTAEMDDIRANVALLSRVLQTARATPAVSPYPMHILTDAAAGLLKGHPDTVRLLALGVIAAHPKAALRHVVYELYTGESQPMEIRREAGAAFLACLALDRVLEKDQLAAVRKMAAGGDDTLRTQAIHAMSIAQISTADRQAHLLESLGAAGK